MVNREAVLFLFQLELDSQLSRALTYEDFDAVAAIRDQRRQVDAALAELQERKGYGSGARAAAQTDSLGLDIAPSILRLRSEMDQAVQEERYSDAARLRDALKQLETQAAQTAADAESLSPDREPAFALGEAVVHTTKGYRGVICGWDLECCESQEWQEKAGIAALFRQSDQIFYHVLVDSRDWPLAVGDVTSASQQKQQQLDEPPVAYIAEEMLTQGSAANFDGTGAPLVDGSFQHPYSYLMFLGADGEGNFIPCRQLRDRYNVCRKDVYVPGELEAQVKEEYETLEAVKTWENQFGGGGGSSSTMSRDGSESESDEPSSPDGA